jgi:hypothetical protein
MCVYDLFPYKYNVPESRDSLIIAIKLKFIKNFLRAAMLLFYILQIVYIYLNKSCILS